VAEGERQAADEDVRRGAVHTVRPVQAAPEDGYGPTEAVERASRTTRVL